MCSSGSCQPANCRCSGADPGWIAAPSYWILGGDERGREQQRQLGTSQGEHLQLRLRREKSARNTLGEGTSQGEHLQLRLRRERSARNLPEGTSLRQHLELRLRRDKISLEPSRRDELPEGTSLRQHLELRLRRDKISSDLPEGTSLRLHHRRGKISSATKMDRFKIRTSFLTVLHLFLVGFFRSV
jgi:hypothetical protein